MRSMRSFPRTTVSCGSVGVESGEDMEEAATFRFLSPVAAAFLLDAAEVEGGAGAAKALRLARVAELNDETSVCVVVGVKPVRGRAGKRHRVDGGVETGRIDQRQKLLLRRHTKSERRAACRSVASVAGRGATLPGQARPIVGHRVLGDGRVAAVGNPGVDR